MLNAEIMTMFIIGIIWSGVGAMLLFVLYSIAGSPVQKADGVEFLNPLWILKTYNVNVFGAFLIAIILAVFCPPVTASYYIYKLCTVRIKKNTDNK